MSAFSSYSTGTVAIAANATSVVGTGSNWSGQNAMSGDTLVVAGQPPVMVSDVTDALHLAIDAWPFAAVSGATYRLYKDSPLRIAGAGTALAVDDMISALETNGFYVFVKPTDTVPDPSLGDDNQYALQATTGKLWQKVGGIWNFVGTQKGFGQPAPWSAAIAYNPFDVATLDGSSYICIAANTNQEPSFGDSPPNEFWVLLAAKGQDGTNGTNGTDGAPGAAATVSVGSTTTGDPGTDASVTNSGTESAAVLDFTIPTGKGYGGSSATSLSIGTGPKDFTDVLTTFAYEVGNYVRASSAADGTNYVAGVLTAYSSGHFTLNVTETGGSGTHSDWNFSIAGMPGADGTATLADTDRRNILIGRIRQSKLLASVDRYINAVADGFKASDGVNASSSANCSVDTTNGRVQPTTSTTTQTSGTASGTDVYNAGLRGDLSTLLTPGDVITDIGVQLASSSTMSLKILQRTGAGAYTVLVSQPIVHPGGGGFSYVTLPTSFTVPATGSFYLGCFMPGGTNSLRLTAINAAFIGLADTSLGANANITGVTEFSSSPAVPPLAVKKNPVPNDMTLVTTAQTTDSSVSNGRALIEFDNTAALVGGTDYTIESTCDGGTHWTSAGSYTVATSHGPSGHTIVETDDVSCTGGTSFAARIKTLTNKNMPIYGVSVTVH